MLNFVEARGARVSARAAHAAGRWATPAERRRGSGASVAMRGLVTERRGGARATSRVGVALTCAALNVRREGAVRSLRRWESPVGGLPALGAERAPDDNKRG